MNGKIRDEEEREKGEEWMGYEKGGNKKEDKEGGEMRKGVKCVRRREKAMRERREGGNH